MVPKLLANMLQKAGADHLMMLEPHSPQLVGFFDRPVDALKVCRNWLRFINLQFVIVFRIQIQGS